ncbi:MAG: pyridoxamine 5'-phosphate oxidase family protein [Proteobacteria bacterium]|nr:pyridoxamine 5'-phosphate oxidase family protein [Pseudomonadota bacterium]MDA1134902.1 pyridoxamine 5'-phosphate oxidase family protein [Pseudomonadota bacterium]
MGIIKDEEQLRKLYEYPKDRAAIKVIKELEKHSKEFLKLSPFVVISSIGADGIADASPRGDGKGFVKIKDNRTIIIPDRSGNNRLDTLQNIIANPAIGLLFFIPGINEVLRINGKGYIEDDIDLCNEFKIKNNVPKSCILINIKEIYMHCAKAIMRSSLWDASTYLASKDFPTISRIINDQINSNDDLKDHQQEEQRYREQIDNFG